MDLKLIDKKKETGDTFSFIFKPPDSITWKAGQFIFYKIPHNNPDDRGEERHFTIATAPHEKNIMLTTKFDFKNGSTFKKALFDLKINDSVEAYNINGNFTIKKYTGNFVFIAGGVGITPYRSILMDIIHMKKSPDVILFYANRSDEIIFKELLDNIDNDNEWLNVQYVIKPKLVDEEVIKKEISDIHDRKYYISGSRKLVESINDILLKLDIKAKNIVKDYFPGY